jgi:hypothetical protein
VKDAVEAARSVVCLHATDASTVYLSAWARLREPSLEAVDLALYRERRLLRMLAMRRTLFVVPVEDAPVLQAGASVGVARVERRRTEQMVARLGIDDVGAWLRLAEAELLAALETRGEATPQELARDVPELQRRLRVNVGKPYESEIGMASRMLLLLAVEGRVVRTRPRGSWISSQFRWAPIERWLGAPLRRIPGEEARAELVRRWLARFGPATEADIRWWTGWAARDARAALAAVGAVEVDLDSGIGFVLSSDVEEVGAAPPWVALLPALDPTTMGWRDRRWYLGDYGPRLFDTAGNAGPTIWVDGRIVGGWAIREDGEVVTGLLEDVGGEAARAIDAEASRLTGFLQAAGVVPRIPMPFSRELLGQG